MSRIPAWVLLTTMLVITIGGRAPAQSAPASQEPPRFPSGVELVTVDAIVLDGKGNPIEALTQDDFTLKEDGDAQTIAAFEAISLEDSPPVSRRRQRVSTNTERSDTAARWFFVVLDDVNISQYSTARAREATTQFIDRALRPGDSVMIATSSGGAWWAGTLPEDRDSLIAYVQRFQGARRPDTSTAHIWDHEAMGIALGRDQQALAQVARRYFEANIIPESYPIGDVGRELDVSPGIALIQSKAREIYREATSRLRTSLVAVDRISEGLTQMRGRKTLLLVSEGFIMDPSQTEFRELVRSARNANAAVNFVDVRSPEGMLGQAGMAGGGAEFGAAIEERDTTTALAYAELEADGARSIALDTGGRIVAGVKMADELARIVNEGRAYYLLGYSPTNKKRDGKFRKIEVIVNRPHARVRARGGYYAPSDKEPPKATANKLDPTVRAALTAPFSLPGIPLRLTSYVFGPQAESKVQILLLAEADLTPLRLQPREGQYSATLDSYVTVHGRDSRESQGGEKVLELAMPADVFQKTLEGGLSIRRDFTLAPGRYQATFVLRDRASASVGSVRHEFEVPAPGQFRASTLVITDSAQPSAGGPPRPVPIARRTFRVGSRLFCAFDVYGASIDAASGGPRVTVGYSLRRADGTEVLAAAPQALKPGAVGQVAVTIALTLPHDSAGQHELRLTVRDEVSTRALEISEPLEFVSR